VAQIIMDYLAHGWSAEEILRQYPHFHPSEIHSAFAYYFDHREEIDSEIAREWQQANKDQQSTAPSPIFLRLKAKGLI